MILATHALVGAAIGRLMPYHPVVALAAGAASHFLLDAIPHWDYRLSSAVKDEKNPLNNDLVVGRNFGFDLIKVGFDIGLGFFLVWLLFDRGIGELNSHLGVQLPSLSLWLGAVGGVFPDFLQFAYFKFRFFSPLRRLQYFHLWIHAKRDLNNRPILGIFLQVIVSFALIMILK